MRENSVDSPGFEPGAFPLPRERSTTDLRALERIHTFCGSINKGFDFVSPEWVAVTGRTTRLRIDTQD
jgi:hypothetical protein